MKEEKTLTTESGAPVADNQNSKLCASIERDAEPSFFAPNNMTWPLQSICLNNQRESVGNIKRAQNLERRPRL